MSATAQHVPVSGFNAPPAGGAPQAPQGFQVPPMGGPPNLPEHSHQYPGQQPGYVNQNPQATPPAQQPAQPQAQQPAAGIDVAALIQAALAVKPDANGNGPTEQPSWLPSDVNAFDVNSIDDPIVKSMASILKSAGPGLDLNRAIGAALKDGDPSRVDVAYIIEKGGANAPQLIQIAQGLVQQVEAQSNKVMQEVHVIAGGEAQWSQATAVFNQSAPVELRMVVKQMLDSTNTAQIKAGAKILTEFGRMSGQIPQLGSPLLNGASSGLGTAGGLSKAQFQQELGKLNPQDPTFGASRENLFTRRALGKRAGL